VAEHFEVNYRVDDEVTGTADMIRPFAQATIEE
jgi:hypothetical protein